MSKVASRGKPKLCRVSISLLGEELSKAVSSIWPAAHKGVKGNRFGGNMGKDIKRMSRNDIREVRDYGNAVPGIRSLVGRGVDGWGSMRKSRGSVTLRVGR
jgi:hypothetical protein